MRLFPTTRRLFLAALGLLASAATASGQVTWNIDNTTNIGGNAVTTVRGAPTVVSTPFGNALKFDGNDGIIVNANPIAGAAAFTIEMLFRPDPIVNASSNQPRVLHVQTANPPDHRATLETRVVGNQWYLDAFLKSQTTGGAASSLTLIDPTHVHPLGAWYNFTMTYDGSQLRAYVDGNLELSGALAVIPVVTGQTSLGMRHNQVNFFEGLIAKVRFTPSIVDPDDFMLSYLPGDFDRDGVVGVADYSKWKTDFGSSVATPGNGADGNRNGIVDAADYTVWRDKMVSGGGAALEGRSVPEPASAWSLVAGFIVLGLRRAIRLPVSFH